MTHHIHKRQRLHRHPQRVLMNKKRQFSEEMENEEESKEDDQQRRDQLFQSLLDVAAKENAKVEKVKNEQLYKQEEVVICTQEPCSDVECDPDPVRRLENDRLMYEGDEGSFGAENIAEDDIPPKQKLLFSETETFCILSDLLRRTLTIQLTCTDEQIQQVSALTGLFPEQVLQWMNTAKSSIISEIFNRSLSVANFQAQLQAQLEAESKLTENGVKHMDADMDADMDAYCELTKALRLPKLEAKPESAGVSNSFCGVKSEDLSSSKQERRQQDTARKQIIDDRSSVVKEEAACLECTCARCRESQEANVWMAAEAAAAADELPVTKLEYTFPMTSLPGHQQMLTTTGSTPEESTSTDCHLPSGSTSTLSTSTSSTSTSPYDFSAISSAITSALSAGTIPQHHRRSLSPRRDMEEHGDGAVAYYRSSTPPLRLPTYLTPSSNISPATGREMLPYRGSRGQVFRFSQPAQLFMQRVFEDNANPDRASCQNIATEINTCWPSNETQASYHGASWQQVRTWFKNRRFAVKSKLLNRKRKRSRPSN